ncbi:MAG: hypothetical protein AAF798_10275 [Bacteroidota bacterium]
MKYSFLLFFLLPYLALSQVQLEWNANIDTELSRGGSDSHYFYNEIFRPDSSWRVDVPEMNLLAKLHIGAQWTFNARLQFIREQGRRPGIGKDLDRYELLIPLLNIEWEHPKERYKVTLGRFIHPFGSFNQRQLSTQRTFIGLPLAYSYFVNISNQVGFMEDMGEAFVRVNDLVLWGAPMLYGGGYTTGAKAKWVQKNGNSWDLALTTGAANLQEAFGNTLNWGAVVHYHTQPNYAWELGYSISIGSFMETSDAVAALTQPNRATQTLVGVDFQWGSGFWEIRGELIGAHYRVPYSTLQGDSTRTLQAVNERHTFLSLSAYTDVKYESPFLSGSFIAYRIDGLWFGSPPAEVAAFQNTYWDDRVLRHSLGIGYKILPYLLARLSVSTQSVDRRPWDRTQRTFRLMVTGHF